MLYIGCELETPTCNRGDTSILLAILKSLTNRFESRGAASLHESAV